MEAEDLVRDFPNLFHMAEDGSWPSIQQHGLLSTSALLDLFEITGDQRAEIESRRRPAIVRLEHPVHGVAVVRDQLPIRDAILAKVLDADMSTAGWYQMLNRHVFFWLSRDRLDRLLNARAYRNRPHLVLEVDTETIVARHHESIRLTSINTGSTLFNPPRRGPGTFQRIEAYPYDGWLRRRRKSEAIVELAIEHAVPDIRDAVISATRRQGGRVLELLS